MKKRGYKNCWLENWFILVRWWRLRGKIDDIIEECVLGMDC